MGSEMCIRDRLYGEFADYVMRDGTPNPIGNRPILYEAHKEEIEEIGRQSKDLC